MAKGQILIIAEGKTDVNLMKRLLKHYEIDEQHDMLSYDTNIYSLYHTMFQNNDPAELDILLHLKSHEKIPSQKAILDQTFSEIILIFDFDPQDNNFSEEKIKQMVEHFTESTDTTVGKLYLNYPMLESFYHMKSIPDDNYNSYTVSLKELRSSEYESYKSRVNRECRNGDSSKFAIDKNECNIVIKQNLKKACILTETEYSEDITNCLSPDSINILNQQLKKMRKEKCVAVLCTCIFYIVDYNPKLLS